MISGRRLAQLCSLPLLAASYVSFHPGLAMTDTYARWAAVHTLLGNVDMPWSLGQWLAPMMAIVMTAATWLGVSTAGFTLLQIGALAVATWLWIDLTSSRWPFWIPAIFLLPAVFSYASFIVPDVWMPAAIVLVVGAIQQVDRGRTAAAFALLVLSSLILFGFRWNSLPLLALIWLMIAISPGLGSRLKVLLALAPVATIAFALFLPSQLGFQSSNSTASVPGWEIVGMERLAREKGLHLPPEHTLEGVIDTDKAVAQHSFVMSDTLIWSPDGAMRSGLVMEKSSEITQRWLDAVMAQPLLFLETKLRIYECLLGLCDDYTQTILYTGDRPLGDLVSYVDRFDPAIAPFPGPYWAAYWFGTEARVLMLPYFWLPIALVAIVISWRRYNRYDWMILVLTAAYGATFLIFSPSASFRYAFPVYAIFTAYTFRAIGIVVAAVIAARRGEPQQA